MGDIDSPAPPGSGTGGGVACIALTGPLQSVGEHVDQLVVGGFVYLHVRDGGAGLIGRDVTGGE